MEVEHQGNVPEVQPIQAVGTEITDQQPVQEKLLPQSQVNSLIRDAHGRGYKKAQNEFQMTEGAYQQKQQASMHGGIQQLTQDQIKAFIDEGVQQRFNDINQQVQKHQADQYAQNVVNNFQEKIEAVRDKYSDFDKVMGDVSSVFGEFPEMVPLLAEMDNGGDVVYDLISNPHKITNIYGLIKPGSSALARRELQKLSTSLKQNEQASGVQRPRDPLNLPKSSHTGFDNGSFSVKDLRRDPKFRR